MEQVSIGLAVIAGFLSFISPCVLPLVPAYIGYMGGRMTHTISMQSTAGEAQSANLGIRLHLLIHGIAFVLGFTFVFVLVGMLTTALVSVAGQYVNTFTTIIGRFGGIVIILFGLQFMGVLPKLIKWLRKKDNAHYLDNVLLSIITLVFLVGGLYWATVEQLIVVLILSAVIFLSMAINGAFNTPAIFWNRVLDQIETIFYSDTRAEIQPNSAGGLLGSAFMGMVFSAGWTPCIGPLLGTILTVAATTGDVAQGMIMLTAYSLGLGIPFILTALLLNSAQGILRRLQKHMHIIELISGTLLVIIGIAVASGQLQNLSQTLTQGDFADFTYRVEECGVGFFEGEVGLSHLGACLNAELVPVALNQSASGEFTVDTTGQQFLFHGASGEPIDIEVRSVNDEVIDFTVTLFAPDDTALVQATKADSLRSDGKLYPIANYVLPEDGLYRAVMTTDETVESSRYRIKIRDAEEIDTTVGAGSSLVDVVASGTFGEQATSVDGRGQGDTLNSLANSALGTITELAENSDPLVGLSEGNIAPDFTVTTDQGEQISLSDLRGNVVLLNFWGTWCGPCRREMPEFQRVYQELSDEGFTILAVAYQDTFEAIRAFREEFDLTFPLALDTTGAINDAYGIQTRPSSFLLDKDGAIITRHFGMMTEEQITEMLAEAIQDYVADFDTIGYR